VNAAYGPEFHAKQQAMYAAEIKKIKMQELKEMQQNSNVFLLLVKLSGKDLQIILVTYGMLMSKQVSPVGYCLLAAFNLVQCKNCYFF